MKLLNVMMQDKQMLEHVFLVCRKLLHTTGQNPTEYWQQVFWDFHSKSWYSVVHILESNYQIMMQVAFFQEKVSACYSHAHVQMGSLKLKKSSLGLCGNDFNLNVFFSEWSKCALTLVSWHVVQMKPWWFLAWVMARSTRIQKNIGPLLSWVGNCC